MKQKSAKKSSLVLIILGALIFSVIFFFLVEVFSFLYIFNEIPGSLDIFLLR